MAKTSPRCAEAVQQFAAAEIAPRAAEIDRSDQFPMDLWRKMGDLGVLGITVDEEYGGAQMGYLAHIVAMEEISRLGLGRPVLRRPLESVRQPDQAQRYRRAKTQIPAETDLRRAHRRTGDVRAERRFRRGQHETARRFQGRPLGPERHQDVDHQRS
ncbi:acyl-CoA dehydrogenase family protein [Massilia sp. B-10]|nr:acyl-CoA dehydrogenase family protein [Massilia sp. B-10]